MTTEKSPSFETIALFVNYITTTYVYVDSIQASTLKQADSNITLKNSVQFQRNIRPEIQIDPNIQTGVLLWRPLRASLTRRHASISPGTNRGSLLLDQGFSCLSRTLCGAISSSIGRNRVLVLRLIYSSADAVRIKLVYT